MDGESGTRRGDVMPGWLERDDVEMGRRGIEGVAELRGWMVCVIVRLCARSCVCACARVSRVVVAAETWRGLLGREDGGGETTARWIATGRPSPRPSRWARAGA